MVWSHQLTKVKAGSTTKPKSSLMDQTRNCGANHKRNIVFMRWCLAIHKKRTFAASNLLLLPVHPKTSTQRKSSYVSSDSSIPTTIEPPIIVPKSSSRGSKFLDIGHPRRFGKCCDRIGYDSIDFESSYLKIKTMMNKEHNLKEPAKNWKNH